MLLRPHHAYCLHFTNFPDPLRGKPYEAASTKVEKLLNDRVENIELVSSPDFFCEACSHFNGRECSHPNGGEKGVIKWDARILEGLGLKLGAILSVQELKSLIKDRAPLDFCLTRCSYYRENKCNPRLIRENFK